jgi:uncharacterized membrane protein
MDADPNNLGQGPDTIATLFRSVSLSVLIVLAAVTIVALATGALSAHAPDIGVVIKSGATIGVALAIGFLHFRHPVPAVSVALAPVPGAILALVLVDQGQSFFPLLLPVFAYVLGFSVALSLADGHVAEIVGGTRAGGDAVRADWRAEWSWVAALLVLGMLVPAILAFAGPDSRISFDVVWIDAASILCVFVATPLAVSLGSYGEDFIARTNRAGENWNRKLDPVGDIVQSRWSWSATGILVVFLALAAFGTATLRTKVTGELSHVAIAALGLSVLFAASALAARAWRRALALSIAVASGVLLGSWGFARTGVVLDMPLLLAGVDVLLLSFAPLAVSAACAARAARGGGDTATASARAIAKKGPIALIMAIAPLMLLAPWYREANTLRGGLLLIMIFAAIAVVVFLPALTGVAEMLVPRRRSVAERYRIS